MTKRFKLSNPSRRKLLAAGLGFTILTGLSTRSRAALPPRALTFLNLHTGEKLTAAYWADGQYSAESARELAWVLRDHRTNTAHVIDPLLFDLLYALRDKVGARKPYEVISCYRSPKTNAALAAATEGVSSHSLHMSGKAIDIRMAGVNLTNLRDAARSLGRGGVGFYPHSDFVHVDTGRPRSW